MVSKWLPSFLSKCNYQNPSSLSPQSSQPRFRRAFHKQFTFNIRILLPSQPLVVIVVQSLSHVWLCDPVDCSMPGLPVHHQLLEFIQIHVHWVGDAIQPSHPLSSPSPPAFNFSQHQGLCIRRPKYWSFSFNISPSNEHPGLISFRMDWLDLLAVQGTRKNLLQHHSPKASILLHSPFFTV